MTESLFDNQRGGERACGNQVDDGGTAWVIRGSQRPDPRKNRASHGRARARVGARARAAGAARAARAAAAGRGGGGGGGGRGGGRAAVAGGAGRRLDGGRVG